MKSIILASASPRRKELMELLPVPFEIFVLPIEEVIIKQLSPSENVMQLASQKAAAVAACRKDCYVIGCDTIVVVDGEILGKPKNVQDATNMLKRLSGREHMVYTGVCIQNDSTKEKNQFYEATTVCMKPLTEEEIAYYIKTGEPMDKAGAYGIQGKGAIFIQKIIGDYYTVMGLPLNRLYEGLKQMQLIE